MILNTDGTKPLYIQISEWLEIEILNGNFESDQKIYSQYQLAEMFNINPATAAKGLTRLVDDGIIYKKRGLGMFVEKTAKEKILNKRKTETLKGLVLDLVMEAERLHVSEDELIEMMKSIRKEGGGEAK
ncbi:GntR family transcriptional regulator [bacterium LRH843]|nr:GntR family transcriptional regulator [bacterium LRH843]